MSKHNALAWLTVIALVAIAWLALPFATGLLFGALLAFSLEPVYRRLLRRWSRPSLVSILLVITTGILIAAALIGFISQFISRMVEIADAARQQLQPGGVLTRWIDTTTSWLGGLGVSPESVASRLESGVGNIASGAAGFAATFASRSFSVLLGLFFALLSMHAVLRHWTYIVAALVRLSPLDAHHTRRLLTDFRRAGRTTATGTVLTGLMQGALAMVSYAVTGVPRPIFLGVATAVASVLPAVGTLLVWVPVGLFLFAIDRPGRAVLELCWGALLVVGFCDYFIRPRLVRDEGMPTLLVFLALFGGLEVMGLPGLVAGPIIVTLAVTVLRLYVRERRTAAPRSAPH